MYPPRKALENPDKPAIVMASSGITITYGDLEARSNRLAHLLRAQGLKRLDHYAVLMENHPRYAEVCAAGERSGLYYTCINSYLTAEEVAYILDNSCSRLLITSPAKLEVARRAMQLCPRVELCLVVDGGAGSESGPVRDYESAVAAFPDTPIADERLGTSMLYSSGTTGRPKGVLRPLADEPPLPGLPLFAFLSKLWRARESMIHLSPAPLYHSAPLANLAVVLRHGGTAVVMEHFDPEQFLALIEKHRVTHSQLVPTMFSRLLKLPAEVRSRHDLSSLEIAIHAAAPCPVPVKRAMIDWWGPVLYEYYAGSEGNGLTTIDSAQWLTHPGSVGKAAYGVLHICDEAGNELGAGQEGLVYFEGGGQFEYHNDPEKTAEARNARGWTTLGDIGRIDEEGYLYLTDRKSFMIISGGVNIYPQEIENRLITHPRVADVAVIGAPCPEMGERVVAVVQPVDMAEAGEALAAELTAWCRAELSGVKTPRQIDFEAELPRHATGKLYKRLLRDRYWGETGSRIV